MPTNYYNILAESLEKKHLNEAWSESMPDWMKPRLNATAMYSDRNANNKIINHSNGSINNFYDPRINSARQKKGSGNIYDTADYAQPRNSNRVGENLYASFISNGIDLQNATFIEGPIPTDKSDPRIQPPNIGIWNFPSTNQVYAKGINDLEKLKSGSGTKYDNYRFEDLRIKALQELSDHFCYIDGHNIPKIDYKAQKDARHNSQDWNSVRHIDRVNAHVDYPWETNDIDKSGYIKVPSSERYAKELRARHGRNYAEKLGQFEDALVKAKQDLISALSRSSINDSEDMGNIYLAASKLQDAIGDYSKILRDVDILLNRYGNDTSNSTFLSEVGDTVADSDYYVRSMKTNLRTTYKRIGSLVGTELDF